MTWNQLRGDKNAPTRLAASFRGDAVLTVDGAAIPVSCELSDYERGSTHWRTGSVTGDLSALTPSDDPVPATLVLSDGRSLDITLTDIDEAGASVAD